MILPTDRSITANDCQRLLDAIQRGELDELDLKNEINAQWNYGYNCGKRGASQEAKELKKHLDRLEKLTEKLEQLKSDDD